MTRPPAGRRTARVADRSAQTDDADARRAARVLFKILVEDREAPDATFQLVHERFPREKLDLAAPI